jgi:folate-dependent phosphoribosylglycinamide formyltransferase PurN
MNTTRHRAVLICQRGAAIDCEGLSRWLGSFTDLVGIVELHDPPRRTWQRARRELARSGWLRFLDALAFRMYYRAAHAAADHEWEREAVRDLQARFKNTPPCTNILQARSANSPEVVNFLRSCDPDLVIARCKTLLRKDVFTIPRAGTFVLHPGICPEYRNAHGCFWALARRDLERVGLTLLRIDEGIDTGPVYGYFTYPFDERTESHVRIQQRVLLENLDAVRERLVGAVEGTATPLNTAHRASAVWGHPWLSAYLQWKKAAREERDADTRALVSRRSA